MPDSTQKYTQFYRNTFEAFKAGDMEAFERLGGSRMGMFDDISQKCGVFEGYKYVPRDAVYLTSAEYRIE